jgi:thioesterase domain-containing protein
MMDPNTFSAETTRFLHEKIPITRDMGVAVEYYDADQLVLTAPLEPNHNHLGTAFGGSLSAIATLAGYGLLWLELDDSDSHIVVKSSTIQYRHPVRETIRAVCKRPDDAMMKAFRKKFARNDKASIELAVTIEENGRACVDFTGVFVALH